VARDYAKEREAFGTKIAQKQAIAFLLANMAIEIDGARLLVWEAAWKLDQGDDALREATLAINQVKRVSLDAADGAVQVFGGHGYIREYLPELHLRNARGLSAFECVALGVGTRGRWSTNARPTPHTTISSARQPTSPITRERTFPAGRLAMPISFSLSDRSQRAQAHFHGMAADQMRPIARKYDDHEHDLPSEWVDWYWRTGRFAQAGGEGASDGFVQVCIQAEELCWGDAGLYLRTPFAGLGGSAVGATGTPEQKQRFLAVFADANAQPAWARWRSPSPAQAPTARRSRPPRASTATTMC